MLGSVVQTGYRVGDWASDCDKFKVLISWWLYSDPLKLNTFKNGLVHSCKLKGRFRPTDLRDCVHFCRNILYYKIKCICCGQIIVFSAFTGFRGPQTRRPDKLDYIQLLIPKYIILSLHAFQTHIYNLKLGK